MQKIILLLNFLIFISCTQISNEIEANLKSVEFIKYSGDSVELMEYHTEHLYENGIQYLTSESLVVKKFDNKKNLIESTEYLIEGKDTIKWSHLEQKYDNLGNLVYHNNSSSQGKFISIEEYVYMGNLPVKESFLTIHRLADLDEGQSMSTSVDSNFHVSFISYNSSLQKISSKIISWNNSITRLKESFIPDTSFQHYTYDDSGNLTHQISVSNTDTTYLNVNGYNAKGEKILSASVADRVGVTKANNEYDQNGNIISETFESDFIKERYKYKYDSHKRLIERRTYKI